MPRLYARFLPLFLLIFAVSAVGWGQQILIGAGNANVCSGTFFDSGGAAGAHAPAGATRQITICSGMPNTAQSHVRVQFQQLEIDGTIRVFNGNSTASPERLPITSGDNGVQFAVTATASNTSGCLTFLFESTGSATGWEATISCVRSCQDIEGFITSTPAAEPLMDGFVDICPGDEVQFSVATTFPENNINYPQSAATSTYTWTFQDGASQRGLGLTSVAHTFEEFGAYLVQVEIEDADGCFNTNRIVQIVRVAPPPIFREPDNLPGSLCANTDARITVGRDLNTIDINFDPSAIPFGFSTGQTLTELVYLPDGNGDEYASPLTFTNFAPGQTLNNASDLVRICATMEHSYLGDLDIYVSCPDGTEVYLHRYQAGDPDIGRQLLGEGSNDTDETMPPDPFGTYCWTATAPRTMREVVRNENIGTNQTVPERDYAPDESLSAFVGCPLNGEWRLNIRDNLTVDNGSIGSWSIEFSTTLIPDQDTFLVPITNYRFGPNDNFAFYGGDTVVFNAPNAGPNTLQIVSTDDYGCEYDTTVTVNVLPPYAPECIVCGPLVERNQMDTAICVGESFTPDVVGAEIDTAIIFESTVGAAFGNGLFPDEDNSLDNGITVTDFFPTNIGNVAADLSSVCLSLENNGQLRDVTVVLISPNNRRLTLIENFGNNGESLEETCFSPTATTPLSSATAPYTGTFQSIAGGWTAFNNAPTNGTWRIIAYDRNGNDVGRFVKWSIGLRYVQDSGYEWTPDDGALSCTNCPNPVITPTSAATYTLSVVSATGCTDTAVVNVTLDTLDVTISGTTTSPLCHGDATGSIDLTATGADAPYAYLWSNNATTEDLTNVPAGTYSVSVSDDATGGCVQVATFTITEPDTLELSLDEIVDVSCFGGSNGELRISTSGGTGNITYLWDDPNAQVEEDAGALTAGTYTLTATDENGCTATLTATVEQPLPLEVTFRSTDVTCREGNDGTAVAVPAGGNGDYSFDWQTGATQDSVSGLSAGNYEVTVTDPLGCSASALVTIEEPVTPLVASAVQDEQGCFGASANRATASGMGGRPGYTYAWSNGENTATAISLPAGTNTVTVTDGGGCEEVVTIELSDLPELTVNVLASLPSCNDSSDGRLGAVPTGGAGTVESDYTYLWSDGRTGVTIDGLTGGQEFSVTVTGPRGCTGVGTRFLNAPPRITFNVDETPVICNGESNGGLQINNISGPNPGNFDLQWGPEAGNSNSPTVSDLPAGNYSLRVSDVDGCSIDTILRITEPPVLGATIDRFDVSCFGDTDGRISVLGTGGVGPYRYAWGTGSNQNQIASLAAGDYVLTVTDANNCEYVETVTILQPEAISISGTSSAVICRGDATGTITLTGGGGRPPFVYGLEGQGFTRNNVFIGLAAGEYVAFVRDSAGCSISTTVVVEDGPVFDLTLPEDQEIIFGDSLQLNPQTDGGVDSVRYAWMGSYPGTLSCLDCEEPIAKPEFEIDYTLTVTDGNGCTDEERFRVSVRKIREVFVPTGFTPNNDGMNDRLMVHGRPGTRVRSFLVFDQWSNEVFSNGDFEVNDVAAGWDGTRGDQPLNAGVYLYKLVIEYEDGSTETLAGESTLLR